MLTAIAEQGMKAWKNSTGYHQRSLAENAMYRLKQLFGDRLASRLFETQVTEVHVRLCHEYHDGSRNAHFRSNRDSCALSFWGSFGFVIIYAPTPGVGGNDTLIGGTGNDTYIVDSIAYTLVEVANAGIDTVQASVSFDLTSLTNIENLTLTGTATINGTGNGLDNIIIGNTASNSLTGGEGNDTIDGGVSDVYNPGVIDTLNGGDGNDTFLVRGFFGAGNYNGGADTTGDILDFSQADAYTAGRRSAEGVGVAVNLAGNLAVTYYQRATNFVWADSNGHISFSGIENVSGTTQSDVIVGNGNDNILDGGASDVYNFSATDIIYGGAGNDTLLSRGFFSYTGYDGGTGNDWIDFSQSDAYTAGRRSAESAGVSVDLKNGLAVTYYQSATNFVWNDNQGHIVFANVENARGSTQNDILVGGSNDNILDGGAGNDTLMGAEGADTLIGGLGRYHQS